MRIFLTLAILLVTVSVKAVETDMTNAFVYIDHFLGGGKTGLVANVISIKKGALKFRIGENIYDYSGNFSILLVNPRQHKNPLFGFGTPEKAKLVTFEDFFKDQTDSTMVVSNATLFEKSEGYIDAIADGKEWIHSGNYTVTN